MDADSSPTNDGATKNRGPWWWVPSLYFAEGVPYVVVMTVAAIMFKRLGVSNTKIALYTSWLYAPYVIKPLWSPLVQRIGTRRSWIVVMQLMVAAGLIWTALSIPLASFLWWSLMSLAAVAISSATHDVAADGFYLLALSSHDQAWFVGIRSIAYRIATIAATGPLIILAGMLESATGLPTMDVRVNAVDRPLAPVQFHPDEFRASDRTEQGIVLSQNDIEISIADRTKTELKKLKDDVRNWNVSHSFYPAPETPQSKANRSAWIVWLEDFIRHHFGPAEPAQKSDRGGDVAVVMMRLAKPVGTGEQQTVQFGRVSGDRSFDVVEGERFVVTESNWNQPFASIVQVEADLNKPSGAVRFEVRSGNLPLAWSVTFFVVAGVFIAFCVYHFIVLPHPAADIKTVSASTGDWMVGLLIPFVDFFRKPRIWAVLAFLLFYRFPAAHLVKLTSPFLLDMREAGGLALTTGQLGIVYGTIGVCMLLIGGLIGGFVVARHGLGNWLWPMALAIHLPNLAFLYLAYAQPENLWAITAAVAVEQFGYGFGFTAYLLFCVYVATGKHETVHYALCTGFMAMGMMVPGMWSGWLQDLIGYQHFFLWVIIAMIPSLLSVAFIRVDPNFGKKAEPSTA